MSNSIVKFILFFVIILMYSCSGGYVKYPSYFYEGNDKNVSSVEANKNKTVVINDIFNKALKYIKANRCDDAIGYLGGLKQSFCRDFCLAVAYSYCSKPKKSLSLLKKIEPEAEDSIWRSRVYALMSLDDIISIKKLYKDYATIAYAYDAKNRLASILMFKRNGGLSETKRLRYFDMVLSWCKECGIVNQ
jgi:hypothetical protein